MWAFVITDSAVEVQLSPVLPLLVVKGSEASIAVKIRFVCTMYGICLLSMHLYMVARVDFRRSIGHRSLQYAVLLLIKSHHVPVFV